MRKLLIFILVAISFTSCEVDTQDWRAKRLPSGSITILDNLDKGYKAGDTISYQLHRIETKYVLLEVISK